MFARRGDGKRERLARAPQKLATIADDFVLTRPLRHGFIDRADHCSDDNHVDQAADAVKNQFSRNGLNGVKAKAVSATALLHT